MEKRDIVNDDGSCDPTASGVGDMNWPSMDEIQIELFVATIGPTLCDDE
jgi:hypothetical protein